jgi:Flp pilus assembly protein TadG
MIRRSVRRARRSAIAAVELAILLPLLAFLTLVAIDWAQVFYYSQTIENCARNGAIRYCDVFNSSKWSGMTATSEADQVKQATLVDAGSLNPALTADQITLAEGTDAEGHAYVEVTVQYTYTLLSNFTIPGLFHIGNDVDLTRTVRMRVAPDSPTS